MNNHIEIQLITKLFWNLEKVTSETDKFEGWDSIKKLVECRAIWKMDSRHTLPFKNSPNSIALYKLMPEILSATEVLQH